MDLNKTLKNNKDNLSLHTVVNKPIPFKENDVLVFDIEACGIKNNSEALTYSIACVSCYDDTYTMYWYNDVEYFLDMLINGKCKSLKIYAHNCLYDVKPFILKFVEKYGNNEKQVNTYIKKEYNKYDCEKQEIRYRSYKQTKLNIYEYDLMMKDGIFYKLSIQTKNHLIEFFDSYKLFPMKLKDVCKSFLDLELPKDGLDYNKERTLDDKLTKEELNYIYDDVFGLKYLIKLCCVDGFDINGKHIKFTKMTSSSQSLYDYKETLIQDYENKSNAFADEDFYQYIDTKLMKSSYFSTNNYEEKLQEMFNAIYPPQDYFVDKWERKSYYGGLCTPHYENCKKYSKRKDKHGIVLDINSMYPYVLESRLLPYGEGNYSRTPYIFASESYKQRFPLYIQKIIIYDFEVKPGHMAWVQVKDNIHFNGRELLKNNIDKQGVKRDITLTLTSVALDLLFECYNVKSYKLCEHIAYKGSYGLFNNYLKFWKEVKQNSKGGKRVVAKLRQNGLYGKFGMNGDTEITKFQNVDGLFTIDHTGEYYVSNSIYLPIATFTTSYAKQILVKAINSNYNRFMYCDTDSIHLFGNLNQVKGVKIDSKEYGAWDNELTFDDFKYLSPKRYAERDINSKEWTIKCCGLTDEIMKKVDDINMFDICEYEVSEVNKMWLNHKIYKVDDIDDIYYYKDEECTQPIKGMFKSKKSKVVKNGTLILEQPYVIGQNNYY